MKNTLFILLYFVPFYSWGCSCYGHNSVFDIYEYHETGIIFSGTCDSSYNDTIEDLRALVFTVDKWYKGKENLPDKIIIYTSRGNCAVYVPRGTRWLMFSEQEDVEGRKIYHSSKCGRSEKLDESTKLFANLLKFSQLKNVVFHENIDSLNLTLGGKIKNGIPVGEWNYLTKIFDTPILIKGQFSSGKQHGSWTYTNLKDQTIHTRQFEYGIEKD